MSGPEFWAVLSMGAAIGGGCVLAWQRRYAVLAWLEGVESPTAEPGGLRLVWSAVPGGERHRAGTCVPTRQQQTCTASTKSAVRDGA